MVDAIARPSFQFYLWQRRGFWWDERPMSFVLAAFLDPLLERLDLFRRELAVRIGGRHFFIGVIGGDAIDEFALREIPRHDGTRAAFQLRA